MFKSAPRIQQLPPEIANQIAAGEVIERPASVVKELLENAFDALAKNIIIDIGYGGLNQITIADDGIGIDKDDLALALSPHATSKIQKIADLYAIQSMGFRGEALASIASVSKLSLSSKPKHQATGMMVHNQSANLKPSPCPRTDGTTIDVRDLFYLTPVRKKFLKSERSEFQAIEALVKRFALSAPKIRIQLNHNGKQHLDLLPAKDEASQLARMQKIFGKTFLEQAIAIQAAHGSMHLEGFISQTTYQRSQNDKLMIYLNNRMVKDKLLYHALKQAYEEVLHPGRYPACLLYFAIAADEVDVNVHPTKHEVRFQEPRIVHDFLVSTLSKAIKAPTLSQKHNAATSIQDVLPHTRQVYARLDTPDIEEKAKGHWIHLNQEYALLRLGEESYLIDVLLFYKERLLRQLQETALPLAHRPLLVPIRIDLPKPLRAIPDIFLQLGFHLSLKTPTQIVVKSLPLLAPHTHLISFIKACLEKGSSSFADYCQLLVAHQQISAHDLQQLDEPQNPADIEKTKGIIHLNQAYCRALFHD